LKWNNTFILINQNAVAESGGWEHSHSAIQTAISRMSWPPDSDRGVVIPRIVTVKPGQEYTNQHGKQITLKGRDSKTLRNGVVPLRQQFRTKLETSGWRAEEPLSLKDYFEQIRANKTLAQIFRYPISNQNSIDDPLHEGVGDFDFWLRNDTGFKTVVEWETGNISSSHRSLNKMCLALMAGLVDAAVLVVPSFYLYPHLTDRIGNIRELQPYFYFWHRTGQLIRQGLLAVVEVEHDELFNSTDERDFIPRGSDGNAFRSLNRRTASRKVRKRAKRAK